MRKKLFLILAMLLPVVVHAQEIIVKSFVEGSVTDLGGTGDIPETNEGVAAALIVVKVERQDINFDGLILKKESKDGEYRVFAAPSASSLTIKIPGFNDKKVSIKKYIPEGMRSRGVYEMQLVVIPKSVVGGRNLSWGISGGYLIPYLDQSAKGYNGSVINYGNGTATENVNYTEAQGFIVGVNADIRLHKNLYLNAGINLGQYRYRNEFNGDVMFKFKRDAAHNEDGIANSMYARYRESYMHTFVEIPLYLSYRFPISRRSNLQIGVGPAIRYGLAAKMKFNGDLTSNEGGDLLVGGDWRNTTNSGEFDMYTTKMDYNEATLFYPKGEILSEKRLAFDKSPLNRLGISGGAYIAYYCCPVKVFNQR